MIRYTLEHVFSVSDPLAMRHNGFLTALRVTADVLRTEVVGLIMGTHC